MALIPQVVDAVKVPVIAAGGIADGRGIAAALKLGAAAAQIGTAFLACEESNATPLHRAKLFSADARRTTLTRAFTGRLARSIHNDFIDALRGKEKLLAPYPGAGLAHGAAQVRGARRESRRCDLAVVGAGRAAAEASPRGASCCVSLVDETDDAMRG